MRKLIIGVVGPGESARAEDMDCAYEIGRLIAGEGWVLLSGGRGIGVMDFANKGAKESGGLTVGILPTGDTGGMSDAVDIPIVTDMGQSRNNINVLSSDLVIACGMGAGTASEIALAIKAKKSVVLLRGTTESNYFFKALGKENVFIANDPQEAIRIAKQLIQGG